MKDTGAQPSRSTACPLLVRTTVRGVLCLLIIVATPCVEAQKTIDSLAASIARATSHAPFDPGQVAVTAGLLKDIYRKQGKAKEALALFELEIRMRDSTHSKEAADRADRFAFRQEQIADSVANEEAKRKATYEHEQVMRTERNQLNGLLFGSLGALLGAIGIAFGLRGARRRRETIRVEKDRSEALLLNILPEEVARELKENGQVEAKHFDQATILFSAFEDFSEHLPPGELVEELDTCFKAFDGIVTLRGIEKIKTIGNVYMCAGGLPDPTTSSPAEVVQAALEMQAFMTRRKTERGPLGKPAFAMRIGIHTGPVVAGIVGVKKFQYDIWGDTVNTASRMQSSGQVGKVNISGPTYELVRATPRFNFTARGKVLAKGKGEMEMHFVSLRP